MVSAALQYPTACSARERHSLAAAPVIAVLRQLAGLLDSMTDELYCSKPAGFTSSIGGHVRHCLDHVESLLCSLNGGELDYDSRRRGTDVETCRRTALDAIARQEQSLGALPRRIEERPLRLTILLSSALPLFEFDTTFGRELAFVLSHTVHHNALIGVMAKSLGLDVPERFGYAPSTIAHLEKTTCAR
jgi:uncharacterized damage-inducible protein DinB